MMNKNTLEDTRKLLKTHNQGHILTFWPQLDADARDNLLAQVNSLNFDDIDGWIDKYITKTACNAVSNDFSAAPSYSSCPRNADQRQLYEKAAKLGRQLISAGRVAAFTVAGGQGTRLGFDGPKGDFPLSPIKEKTLFQIFAETILAASEKYNTKCPWYIMTSPLNHCQTVEIFRSNDYYGLDEKDVFIFQQGTIVNFSSDGKILLADKAHLACSPDGHGGSLKALHSSGALTDMNKRGIEFISYFQVDNPLVNIFDPLFIGLHALDGAEMSSKAILKTDPTEKVGNFCLVDGKVTVIEYSDLPKDLAEKKNPDNSLVFRLGSIAIHIINTDFVETLNDGGFSLPLHKAVKKIPHIDENAKHIEPSEPNGIKLETFVFDALPLASKSIIMEIDRTEEFAPVKNAAGTDSVQTARRMMVERGACWLKSAGVEVPRKADGSVDAVIEISPAFALETDDIKAKLQQIPEIKPGDRVYLA